MRLQKWFNVITIARQSFYGEGTIDIRETQSGTVYAHYQFNGREMLMRFPWAGLSRELAIGGNEANAVLRFMDPSETIVVKNPVGKSDPIED